MTVSCAEIVQALQNLFGCSTVAGRKAALATGNASADGAAAWLLEHMSDEGARSCAPLLCESAATLVALPCRPRRGYDLGCAYGFQPQFLSAFIRRHHRRECCHGRIDGHSRDSRTIRSGAHRTYRTTTVYNICPLELRST